MRCMIILFLILFTQSALASEIVKTKYGTLEIKSIDEYETGLLINSTVIFKREGGYLNIEKVFHLKDSEVALISSDEGGAGTLPSYFFVTLKPNSSPIILGEFWTQRGEITPIQKGEEITIDLGYKDGVHEILTYQNGKQFFDKKIPKENVQANEYDCNFLYNDIYLAYVKNQKCTDAPEDINGMSTARDYYSLSNDPRLRMERFQDISKASCKQGEWIKYSEFKARVCGG